MSKLYMIPIMLAVIVSGVVQILTDPRFTRAFIKKSAVALVVFATHVAIGLLVVVYLLPHIPDAAAGVTVAILGWIGLGTLGLIRFAPRMREPPAILMQFGIADVVGLLVLAIGLFMAIGASR
jgi:hypothetical protein